MADIAAFTPEQARDLLQLHRQVQSSGVLRSDFTERILKRLPRYITDAGSGCGQGTLTALDTGTGDYTGLQVATVTVAVAPCGRSSLIGTSVEVVDWSECVFDRPFDDLDGVWVFFGEGVAESLDAGATAGQKTPCHWVAHDRCCVDADTAAEIAPPAFVSTTTNYTLSSADTGVLADATGGAITITLPAAASNTDVQFFIKKIDSSGNTVTVDGNGSETIDGATTQVISTQYATLTVYSNGTSWFLL